MTPRLATFLAGFVALLVAVGAIAGGGDLLDAWLQRPAAARGTVVVPDHFLRRWDPVTIFFDRAIGKPGPEDAPDRWAVIDPAQPGAWRWVDARTLQFQPAEPWPALSVVTVKADDRAFPLATLVDPPTSTSPGDGATELAGLDTIQLTFPGPVPPEILARMATIELRPLPGSGSGAVRRLAPEEFAVKELDRTGARAPVTYALLLDHPVPLGTRVVLRLGLSVDQAQDVSLRTLTFDTARPFRPQGIGCDGGTLPVGPDGARYPDDQPLVCTSTEVRIDFSASLAELSPVQARDLVRFDPAVAGLSIAAQGASLVLSGEFERDRPYRMTFVPGPIRDANDRPLDASGDSAVTLLFPRQRPYLTWTDAQGIAELHGPKRVPLQGRGHPKADLRILKLDPRDRSFWPFPDRAVDVDETGRPPGPGEAPEPWTAAGDIDARRLATNLKIAGPPAISEIVDLPLSEDGGAARFGLDLAPWIERIEGGEKPGHYLVGLRRLDGTSVRSWVRLQVTDLVLSTVEEPDRVEFLVTSLSTGQPVSGARVEVQGTRSGAGKSSFENLFSGFTDGDGRLSWRVPGAEKGVSVAVLRLLATKGDDVLALDARRPPDAFADGSWRRATDGWLQWAFSDTSRRGEPSRTLCHLFTERPVYRPEEPVYLQGWARTRDAGRLTVIRDEATLRLRGPGGRVVEQKQPLDAQGGVFWKWDEREPETGTWTAELEVARQRPCQVSFQVEAYRLPTFEVGVNGPAHGTLDQPFDVGLVASYYAGGRVARRPVRWRVTQYPLAWTPKGPEGFFYASDGRYGGGARFDSTPTVLRDGTTDDEGTATLSIDPTIEPTAQPRVYVVEATVTGVDEETVTETARVEAVPPFVVGLDVPRYVAKAGRIRPRVLAVDPDGAMLAGRELVVRLKHRQWTSHLQASDFTDGVARYITDIVEDVVLERTVTTGQAPVEVPLDLPRSGVYLVEVEGRDALGRTQVVSVDLYAGGDEPVSWAKPKAGVFELSADQASYRPGQTAHVVLHSPFQSAEALAIVEAPSGTRLERLRIRGGKGTLDVPIAMDEVPRVPVHVVLLRGRADAALPATPSAPDLGKPTTLASTLWLPVEPVENVVNVAISGPARALPGEEVSLAVRLTDDDGRPIAGHVALWLVDTAVLALGKEQRLDPLPDFVTDRRSHVTVKDTRNLAFGRVPFDVMPGGDEGEEEQAEGALDNATVRKNFLAVPFYDPDVVVGASGTATVKVKLPDNLTRFAIRAKAVSGAERFGAGKGEIQVRLPVIAQPSLPRFVRPGDRFVASGNARVIEGDGGAGSAEIRVDGLVVDGSTRQPVTLDTAVPARLAFPVTVPTPSPAKDGGPGLGEVVVTMGVKRAADGAADAFEVHLPVRPDRLPTYERALLELSAGQQGEIAAIAEPARPGTVRRSIVLSTDPAYVKMAAGLDFLRAQPVGSTEQRISRARAWLGLGKLRGQLGMVDEKAAVDAAVREALDALPDVVDGAGRVANWPGTEGQIALTAWAVEFLVEAKEAGYPVDQGLEDELVRTLQRALRSDYRYFLDGERWTERTLALEALTDTGRFDGAYFSELARNARFLDHEAVAAVLLAGSRAGQGHTSTALGLADALHDGITVRLYQGSPIYGGLVDKGTARNPLILPGEARQLASMTRALTRVRPDDDRLPLMEKALVQLGRTDGWGDTNASAAAMLALVDRVSTKDHAAASVRVGGQKVALGRDVGAAPIVLGDAGATTVGVDAGSAPVLVLGVTRYLAAADGSREDPSQQGFVVSREALHVQADGPPKRQALAKGGETIALAPGDVVEDHVQVVVPEDRHYVAITVPLAAGMEPLNPRLATAPPEATPTGRSTREASFVQFLDDRVVYTYETLPKGTYDFYFRTKAMTPGTFVQPAARAEMLYRPATFGASAGARVEVR